MSNFVSKSELQNTTRVLLKRINAGGGGGGSGDMLKAVYDTDNDGVVDNAEKVGGRTIYVSDLSPSSNDGQDGDIWLEY